MTTFSTIAPNKLRRALLITSMLIIAAALYSPDNALAQVTGSGTQGKIPKWSGTTALTDSVISESSGGNIGIGTGTTTPGYKLDIFGGAASQFHLTSGGVDSGLYLLTAGSDSAYYLGGASFNGTSWIAKSTNASLFAEASGSFVFYGNTGLTPGSSFTPTERVRIDSQGNVGIGTTSPNSLLHTKTKDAVNTLIIDSGLNSGTWSDLAFFDRGVYKWELVKTPDNQFGIYDSPAGQYRVFVKNNGTVGIATGTSPDTNYKLHVAGDVRVDGNIAAKYQDVAEWVPARHAMPAGTVVVLDTEHSNQVLPSSRAYDTRVAGVISANPGLILGERGEGKLMVATTGRVKVKVDATSAPIRVGDLLVTSDKEGIAMRSQPLDLAGTPIHRPGTLIGKALEPLQRGVGEILVLLSMQ